MKLHARLLRFVIVGTTAAIVHFGAVVALVEGAGVRPLLANVLGWLLAFVVSFIGQRRLTFGDRVAPFWLALRRFFAVSALGFALNEAAYAFALHLAGMRYDIALALVLVGVAVITYLLSSAWAFRHRSGPGTASSR